MTTTRLDRMRANPCWNWTIGDVETVCLEAAGVEFIPENGGGAGVRLRKVSGT